MNGTIKWKALIGLALIALSLVTNWHWIWAIFFAFWVISDIRSGFTHLFEPVGRKENPFLYWLIVAAWALLGAYSVAYYSSPQWFSQGYDQSYSTYVYDSEPENKAFNPISHQTSNYRVSDKKNETQEEGKEPSLSFDRIDQEAQKVVGITIRLTGDLSTDQRYVNELWTYFAQNDISPVIQNIAEDRVYLVYSDFEGALNAYTRATLGYRVSEIGALYEGLYGAHLHDGQYAVFRSKTDSEQFLQDIWSKIADASMNLKGKKAVEVYSFNNENQVTETELRIEL